MHVMRSKKKKISKTKQKKMSEPVPLYLKCIWAKCYNPIENALYSAHLEENKQCYFPKVYCKEHLKLHIDDPCCGVSEESARELNMVEESVKSLKRRFDEIKEKYDEARNAYFKEKRALYHDCRRCLLTKKPYTCDDCKGDTCIDHIYSCSLCDGSFCWKCVVQAEGSDEFLHCEACDSRIGSDKYWSKLAKEAENEEGWEEVETRLAVSPEPPPLEEIVTQDESL
jgi:hypothetical protein